MRHELALSLLRRRSDHVDPRPVHHPDRRHGLERSRGRFGRFNWDYDDGRDRLLVLYQKGKDKQWDAAKRIDRDIEVDCRCVLGAPVAGCGTYMCLLVATRA